jgi:hypothetical protein
VCRACSKKNRPCQWDSPQSKFKVYQPEGTQTLRRPSATGTNASSDTVIVDGDESEGEGEGEDQTNRSIPPNEHQTINRRNSRTKSRSDAPSSATSQHLPDVIPDGSNTFPLHASRSRHSSGSSLSAPTLLRPHILSGTRPYSQTPIPLTHDEAVLVHHYTEHLGRWLDCTDATRQFTLGVPGKVKLCPVLCHAVLSFAARHRKEEAIAEAAYQRCIALLIDRLNEDAASHDETLLCAIVILRFYEQLSGECPCLLTCLLTSRLIASSSL